MARTQHINEIPVDLIQEKLSSFNYNLPEDVAQQLWDFYLMTFLPKSNDDVLGFVADESKEDLYGSLKESLLEAVFFAVTAETRHIYDNNKVMGIIEKLDESDRSCSSSTQRTLLS
jgi:hypothetical protein